MTFVDVGPERGGFSFSCDVVPFHFLSALASSFVPSVVSFCRGLPPSTPGTRTGCVACPSSRRGRRRRSTWRTCASWARTPSTAWRGSTRTSSKPPCRCRTRARPSRKHARPASLERVVPRETFPDSSASWTPCTARACVCGCVRMFAQVHWYILSMHIHGDFLFFYGPDLKTFMRWSQRSSRTRLMASPLVAGWSCATLAWLRSSPR